MIASTASSITAQGNGATTVWPFNFVIPGSTSTDQTNVLVTLLDTTVDPPVKTTLATNQYSITGVSTPSNPTTGGSVTDPLTGSPVAAGHYITIQLNVPLTQDTSFPNQGAVFPKVIESTFDDTIMAVQQVAAGQALSLQADVADPAGAPGKIPLASVRANKVLAFD